MIATISELNPNTPPSTTVGNLPLPGSVPVGTRMTVTNALLPASLAIVVGGGAITVSVMNNGVAWIVQ